MKRSSNHYFLIVMLLTLPILTFSQSVEFTYDASGNRIQREIILPKSCNSPGLHDSITMQYDAIINDVDISIIPNPNGGRFTVLLSETDESTKASLFLYSSSGNLIYQKENVSHKTNVDISNHESGAYFLYLIINGKKEIWKVIKQ